MFSPSPHPPPFLKRRPIKADDILSDPHSSPLRAGPPSRQACSGFVVLPLFTPLPPKQTATRLPSAGRRGALSSVQGKVTLQAPWGQQTLLFGPLQSQDPPAPRQPCLLHLSWLQPFSRPFSVGPPGAQEEQEALWVPGCHMEGRALPGASIRSWAAARARNGLFVLRKGEGAVQCQGRRKKARKKHHGKDWDLHFMYGFRSRP